MIEFGTLPSTRRCIPLVADHDHVGVVALGELDHDLGRITLARPGPAGEPALLGAVLGIGEQLLDALGLLRVPFGVERRRGHPRGRHCRPGEAGRLAVVGAQDDELRLMPRGHLDRELDRLVGRRAAVGPDGDHLDHAREYPLAAVEEQ